MVGLYSWQFTEHQSSRWTRSTKADDGTQYSANVAIKITEDGTFEVTGYYCWPSEHGWKATEYEITRELLFHKARLRADRWLGKMVNKIRREEQKKQGN